MWLRSRQSLGRRVSGQRRSRRSALNTQGKVLLNRLLDEGILAVLEERRWAALEFLEAGLDVAQATASTVDEPRYCGFVRSALLAWYTYK